MINVAFVLSVLSPDTRSLVVAQYSECLPKVDWVEFSFLEEGKFIPWFLLCCFSYRCAGLSLHVPPQRGLPKPSAQQ